MVFILLSFSFVTGDFISMTKMNQGRMVNKIFQSKKILLIKTINLNTEDIKLIFPRCVKLPAGNDGGSSVIASVPDDNCLTSKLCFF